MTDSREEAINIKLLLERSRNGCRGRGPKMLFQYYIGSLPWETLSPSQRWLMKKVEKKFKAQLIAAGFLPPPSPR